MRPPIKRSRQQHALLLPARECRAKASDDRVVLHGHSHNFFIDHRHPGAFAHTGRIVLSVEKADVVLDGADEKLVVLHDRPNPGAVVSGIPIHEIATIDSDLTLGRRQ